MLFEVKSHVWDQEKPLKTVTWENKISHEGGHKSLEKVSSIIWMFP